MAAERGPYFSVIVPVVDGGGVFERCLEALRRSRFTDYELLVVDDGSTDGSAAAARRFGARVLRTAGREGPAAARNLGAKAAAGEVLFFVDADCEVHPDTLERAAAVLRADPKPDALFGSYDDRPSAPGLVSRFRNLLHHWVHQRGDPEAVTFWAGCGTVRRRVFDALGGFDASRFRRPSVEDIELGYRLTAGGGRIRLDREILVTHHKRWTLAAMIRADLLDRALPWTRLILERRGRARELNLGLRERASVALTGAATACVPLAWLLPRPAVAVAALSLGAIVALHHGFYRFLRWRGGTLFALGSIPLHLVHFACGGAGYVLGLIAHAAGSRASRAGEARRG